MLRIMMLGCLTVSLLLAGGGYMAWRWWETEGKQRAAEEMKKVVDTTIDQSGLSGDDKKKLRSRIDRTVDDFKTGKVSFEDLGRLLQEIGDSPVMAAAAVQGALLEQLKQGGGALQDPQKRAEAQRTLERFIRAIMEQKVDGNRTQEITAALRESTPEGDVRIKEKVTPEDVQKVLAGMKKAVDDAKIPDERFQVDYVGEITKIIDRVLAKPAQ